MTTVQLQIPDDLAVQAKEAGLLDSSALLGLLRNALAMRGSLADLLRLTEPVARAAGGLPEERIAQEVQAEIDAYRRDKRSAASHRP